MKTLSNKQRARKQGHVLIAMAKLVIALQNQKDISKTLAGQELLAISAKLLEQAESLGK